MMACSDALMAQERSYQALLQAMTALMFTPDGGLLLKADDGRSIRLRPDEPA